MESIINQQEQKNKRRGMTLSVILHILLLLLAILPILTFPDPPPGQEGILVNLGIPDVGQGDDNAGPSQPQEEASEPVVEEIEESEPEEIAPEPEPEPEPVEVEVDPEPVEKEVVKTEDPEAIALKKKREKERKEKEAREKAEAERKRKERAEAERKRKEREAKEKAEAERKRKEAEANKFKDQIGGLFGDGKGKGDTGKPGNQGDPNGDPNADKLKGISSGSGQVGGGLSSRGISKQPKVSGNFQKSGKVVLDVCVDQNGRVTKAEYKLRGSTTSDAKLISIAKANAKNWRFTKGSQSRQCGTITYLFKVK